MKNPETASKTKYHLALFQEYNQIKFNDDTEMTQISVAILDERIASFIVNIRKKNKAEYETTTLHSMQASFDRHLREEKYGYFIATSPEFDLARRAMKSKCTDLKGKGKGNLDHATDPLTPDDIKRLYETGQLGTNTPMGIINILWTHMMLQCGFRGGKAHRRLRFGDVTLQKDSTGEEFLNVKERKTKTRTGEKKPKQIHVKKIYGNKKNPEACPVEAFKIYSSRRPSNFRKTNNMKRPDSPFYISVNTKPLSAWSPTDPWYISLPMGVGKLQDICKNMCRKAGIDTTNRNISNHSLRKTMIQTLCDQNIDANVIAQVLIT